MRIKPFEAFIGAVFSLIALVVTPPISYAGQDICVTCAAPNMTYRCRVDTGATVPGTLSLQLFCMRELARQGGHANCSVKRQSQAECNGTQRQLVYAAQTRGIAAAESGEDAMDSAQDIVTGTGLGPSLRTATPSTPSQGLPNSSTAATHDTSAGSLAQGTTDRRSRQPNRKIKEPSTIAKLSKNAAQSSKKQLQKASRVVTGGVKSAGKTVGKAAKKTWRCLSSLFNRC